MENARTRTADLVGVTRLPGAVWAAIAVVTLALLAYSQSVAYFGNEAFHLLAARLILAGKRPYLDFFYQHTPLYAYVAAGWMLIFGDGWRSAHVLSVLLLGGCMVLAAGYVYARLSDTRWRTAAACLAVLLVGLNAYVVCYGTVGFPFALCLFLTMAAFRFTVASVVRTDHRLPFLAGLCGSAAVTTSLFSIPVALACLVWMIAYTQTGSRMGKLGWFLAGAAIPTAPIVYLFALSPQHVFFDVVEYHLFYRVGNEGNMLVWNLREVGLACASLQGSVLVQQALIGLALIANRTAFDSRVRREITLCLAIAGLLGACLAIPRPTFDFYFILVTPFLAIPAAVGAYAIGTRIRAHGSAIPVAVLILALYAVGLAGQVFKLRREIASASPRTYEAIAAEVNRVTPEGGWIYASEPVYLEARRTPPPGLENAFNPFSRADEWLEDGRFDTVCVMAGDPRIESLGLSERYARSSRVQAAYFSVIIFSDRVEPGSHVAAGLP